MIVAFTGHRPEKCEDEDVVREKFRVALQSEPVDTVICGMAAGVDLWAGDEARKLGTPLWAAIPWKGHGPRKVDEDLYARVLDYAERVEYMDDSLDYPGPYIYQVRNVWMVDHATHVLAYHNGDAKGGTFNCLAYARGRKPVRNIYG